MQIKPFYTVVVIKPDMFESTIVDERHFGSEGEASIFAHSVADGLIAVITLL